MKGPNNIFIPNVPSIAPELNDPKPNAVNLIMRTGYNASKVSGFINAGIYFKDNTNRLREIFSDPVKFGLEQDVRLLMTVKLDKAEDDEDDDEEYMLFHGYPLELAAALSDEGLIRSLMKAGFTWKVNETMEIYRLPDTKDYLVSDHPLPGYYLQLRNPDFCLIFADLSKKIRGEIIDAMYASGERVIFGEQIHHILKTNRYTFPVLSDRGPKKVAFGDREYIKRWGDALSVIAERNEGIIRRDMVFADLSFLGMGAPLSDLNELISPGPAKKTENEAETDRFYAEENRKRLVAFLGFLKNHAYQVLPEQEEWLEEQAPEDITEADWEDYLVRRLIGILIPRRGILLGEELIGTLAEYCGEHPISKWFLISLLLKNLCNYGSGMWEWDAPDEHAREELDAIRNLCGKWGYSTERLIEKVWGRRFVTGSFYGYEGLDKVSGGTFARILKEINGGPYMIDGANNDAMNLLEALFDDAPFYVFEVVQGVTGSNTRKSLWEKYVRYPAQEQLTEALERNVIPKEKVEKMAEFAAANNYMASVPILLAYGG